MTKINKGEEYVPPIPFDGEDVPRETKKTHIDKRIDHIQTGLKADKKLNPKRPLNEFAELVNLIAKQFDDDTSNIKSEVIPCQII